jgi:hypothetical protein
MSDKPAKTSHPYYKRWSNMLNRCRNPKFPGFENYGGRGISVDPMWDHFWTFVFDMGPKPSPKHSLDRIDNIIMVRTRHQIVDGLRGMSKTEIQDDQGCSL